MKCSFCDEDKEGREYLFQGLREANICDICIEICNKIMKEGEELMQATAPKPDGPGDLI